MAYTAPAAILQLNPQTYQTAASSMPGKSIHEICDQLNNQIGQPCLSVFGLEDEEDYIGILLDSSIEFRVDQNLLITLNAEAQAVKARINHPIVDAAEIWIVPNFN